MSDVILTPAEQILVTELRALLSDDDATKNILNGKKQVYSDAKLLFFIKLGLSDVNSGSPKTAYTLDTFPKDDDDLIVQAAMVLIYMAEGVLQLRNQIDYSDAGLSVALFNKTGGYQGWAGFILQQYSAGKAQFKRGVWANTSGAGFVGIASGFHTDYGRW